MRVSASSDNASACVVLRGFRSEPGLKGFSVASLCTLLEPSCVARLDIRRDDVAISSWLSSSTSASLISLRLPARDFKVDRFVFLPLARVFGGSSMPIFLFGASSTVVLRDGRCLADFEGFGTDCCPELSPRAPSISSHTSASSFVSCWRLAPLTLFNEGFGAVFEIVPLCLRVPSALKVVRVVVLADLRTPEGSAGVLGVFWTDESSFLLLEARGDPSMAVLQYGES